MRHKKRTMRKRGGAWEDYIPEFLKAKPATPTQILNDPGKVVGQAQQVTDQTVGNVVKPLGVPEPTNTPGGLSSSAPVNDVLRGARRRRRKTKRSRKFRR